MSLLETLIRHEGLEMKPYVCPAGKLSIGIGRNLEDRGISRSEAILLAQNDITQSKDELYRACPWALKIETPRRDVLVMMIFNMGLTRFLTFKKMLAAVQSRDFVLASAEMLESKWAKQVGPRAFELAQIMRTGRYPKQPQV